jgi:hypothetical protein
MNEIIGKLIESALKLGIYKITGYTPPKEKSGCLGCFAFLLFIALYIAGICYFGPMTDLKDSLYLLIYFWPLVLIVIYLGWLLLIKAPLFFLFIVAFIWFIRYSHLKGWM